MDERSADEQIEDLRRTPERRGVGDEGRTKEEQDRAMSGGSDDPPPPAEQNRRKDEGDG